MRLSTAHINKHFLYVLLISSTAIYESMKSIKLVFDDNVNDQYRPYKPVHCNEKKDSCTGIVWVNIIVASE